MSNLPNSIKNLKVYKNTENEELKLHDFTLEQIKIQKENVKYLSMKSLEQLSDIISNEYLSRRKQK